MADVRHKRSFEKRPIAIRVLHLCRVAVFGTCRIFLFIRAGNMTALRESALATLKTRDYPFWEPLPKSAAHQFEIEKVTSTSGRRHLHPVTLERWKRC